MTDKVQKKKNLPVVLSLNDDVCLHYIFHQKYGKKPFECGKCNKFSKFYRVNKRKCFSCEHCGYQLHPLANTIFHKSSTPLKIWFQAIYFFMNSPRKMTARRMAEQLNVSYKGAWRMLKKIELLLERQEEFSFFCQLYKCRSRQVEAIRRRNA